MSKRREVKNENGIAYWYSKMIFYPFIQQLLEGSSIQLKSRSNKSVTFLSYP
jgi:hypothetical protein